MHILMYCHIMHLSQCMYKSIEFVYEKCIC